MNLCARAPAWNLMVAHGHGFDAIGFDLDERNLELARERVGPMFFQEVTT